MIDDIATSYTWQILHAMIYSMHLTKLILCDDWQYIASYSKFLGDPYSLLWIPTIMNHYRSSWYYVTMYLCMNGVHYLNSLIYIHGIHDHEVTTSECMLQCDLLCLSCREPLLELVHWSGPTFVILFDSNWYGATQLCWRPCW